MNLTSCKEKSKGHVGCVSFSGLNQFSTRPLGFNSSQLFSHTAVASIRIGWPVAAAATELPRCSRRIHQKSSALLLPARTTAAYYHPASLRLHAYLIMVLSPAHCLAPLPCTSRQASSSKDPSVYHPHRWKKIDFFSCMLPA